MITTAYESDSKCSLLPEPSEGVEWVLPIPKTGGVRPILPRGGPAETPRGGPRSPRKTGAPILRRAKLCTLSCSPHGPSTVSRTDARYARVTSDREFMPFFARPSRDVDNFRNKHKRPHPRTWVPSAYRELWALGARRPRKMEIWRFASPREVRIWYFLGTRTWMSISALGMPVLRTVRCGKVVGGRAGPGGAVPGVPSFARCHERTRHPPHPTHPPPPSKREHSSLLSSERGGWVRWVGRCNL